MTRRLLPIAVLLLAGCAANPRPELPGENQAPPPVVQPAVRGGLIGLTAGELYQRLGAPALQVREGSGLKLQFRTPRCVIDTYLYPPVQGGGSARVTHVDTRLPSGADIDQRICLALPQAG